MGNGPACPTCGTALRWIPESAAWGCDRCRVLYPVGGPGPAVGRGPGRPLFRNPKLPLYLGIGAAGVAAVALALFFLLGRHGGGGGASSADDVIKGSLAAVAAGDVDALLELADPAGLADRAYDCSEAKGDGYDLNSELRELRSDFTDLVAKAKGLTVELVDRDDRDGGEEVGLKPGSKVEGCRVITAVRPFTYRLTLRVAAKDGKPREQKTSIKLFEVDGHWFLAKAPAVKPPGVMDQLLADMIGFKDRMCACKDKDCANAVNADWNRWTQDMSKLAGMDDKPDEEVVKQFTDAMQAFTACQMKL